jgi:hypothetical protein
LCKECDVFFFESDNERMRLRLVLDELTFGQMLEEMKLDESTLDQLNWTSRILGELKLDKSKEYRKYSFVL